MNSSTIGRILPRRWAIALSFVAVTSMAPGCGSSGGQPPPDHGGALAKQLKDEELYKVTGTGKNARKEPITLREKAKLLHQLESKSQ